MESLGNPGLTELLGDCNLKDVFHAAVPPFARENTALHHVQHRVNEAFLSTTRSEGHCDSICVGKEVQ